MQDLFCHLSATSLVLDLGCAGGSFNRNVCPARVVRVDLETPPLPVHDDFVRSDAAALPFPGGCFHLIVSNHSLEHFEKLTAALADIGRVLAPGGVLYVAAPDASTVTDRLYRWLARGGGHVNAFTSLEQLVAEVERGTALRLRSARVLCTSLSFLNRRNHPGRAPRKLWLLGGGNETALRWLTWGMRLSDRWFRPAPRSMAGVVPSRRRHPCRLSHANRRGPMCACAAARATPRRCSKSGACFAAGYSGGSPVPPATRVISILTIKTFPDYDNSICPSNPRISPPTGRWPRTTSTRW